MEEVNANRQETKLKKKGFETKTKLKFKKC